MNNPKYALNIEVMNGQELFLQARPIPLIGFRPTESTGDVEYCDDYPSTPVQDRLYVTPTGARIYRGGRFIEFPVLDATGRLRIAQMPDGISGGADGKYIPVEWRGKANGVASLNANGVVPSGQLPQMNYISRTEKGASNGVATLGQDGKVPSGQLPPIKSEIAWNEVTDKPEFAEVATTGSYNDLTDTPTIPNGSDYVPKTDLGEANGVATLGADGKLAAGQMPSVDTSKNWGDIGGTLADQTDLADALDKKANLVDGKVPSEELPTATKNSRGVIMLSTSYATNVDSFGALYLTRATNQNIDAKVNHYQHIVPSNLDYAVRSVLPNVTTIPATTTSYSLLDASATTNNHSWQYFHAPEAASTYTFPAVTDTAVAHRIKLTIDFTAVQTYSFEDSEGTAIAPLFTPSISAGDVYEFDCEYSVVKSQWLIWPHKQGAVSDDYVMQSQVGAANGVAELDSGSLVPRANLPLAGPFNGSNYPVGAVKMGNAGSISGITIGADGGLNISPAPNNTITSRTYAWNSPIVPSNLNYAVTAALTDQHKISLTDAQKASAQDTLGVGAAPIIGTTAPTTSTAGSVGQLYVDTTTSKTYHCTAITNKGTESEPVWSYAWTDDINANGGLFTNDISIGGGTSGSAQSYRYLNIGRNNTISSQYNWRRVLVVGENNNIGAGYNRVIVGDNNNIVNLYNGIVVGNSLKFSYTRLSSTYGKILAGGYNVQDHDAVALVGNGTSSKADNVASLSRQGDLWISGGYQARKTIIPAGTSSYTLNDGHFSHTPSNASTYVLPDVYPMLVVDNTLCVRKPSTDGTSYYGWRSGPTDRYTASATPSVGDNTYTNTALTQGAKAVTAIDNRTHEITLDVDFSTVQTFSFEDADGNTLSLQKDITVLAGDKWRFICIYEYGMWLIYPLQLKAETVTPTTPVSISGDTSTAISEQLSATASGNGILTYTATGLPAGVSCSSTGLISGTPTTAGTYVSTVTVSTKYARPAAITVNFEITEAE